MAKKPTLYIDANIFSALHTIAGDPAVISRRNKTRDWWTLERIHFDLFASQRTELELRTGVYNAQRRAVAEVRRINYLAPERTVKEIALQLIKHLILPAQEDADAVHLAFCIHYQMDYLLTWNYSHLVNSDAVSRLEMTCGKMDWHVPSLVSPDTIPWVTFGASVQRRSK